ncbi:MAG: holo-ACP synthase [Roseburia sp.]|nr:holo-ACP synthase [Roseburia sp.]
MRIAVGVDTACVARVQNAIENDAFVARVFTAKERAYCDGRPRPAESYAGIFCAKEAAAKAIKRGFGAGFMPTDIEVTHTADGAPTLRFYGRAAEMFSAYDCDVSISHDGGNAVATVVLAARNDLGGDNA